MSHILVDEIARAVSGAVTSVLSQVYSRGEEWLTDQGGGPTTRTVKIFRPLIQREERETRKSKSRIVLYNHTAFFLRAF